MSFQSMLLMTILGGALSFEFSFSEFNTLYHFDDLNIQFSYLKDEHLKYELRLTNNIKTINDIQSDLMLIVEYDHNKRSGAYLNSKKVLEEQLKETIGYFLTGRTNLLNSLRTVEGNTNSQNTKYVQGCDIFVDIYQTTTQEVPDIVEKIKNSMKKLTNCRDGLKAIAVASRPSGLKPDDLTDDELKANMADVLWKKIITITKAEELFLSKPEAAKYRMVGFDKKCGIVLEGDRVIDINGSKVEKCIFENTVPETTKLQSNVVFYNTEKFEMLSNSIAPGHLNDKKVVIIDNNQVTGTIYPEVYTVKDGKGILTQNFGVYLLKYKVTNNESNEFGLIFVATHFKAKKEGYVSRQKTARAITAVIKNIKKILKKWDVLVSGDLNSEIEEITMDFNEPIIRLENQMAQKFTYKPSKVFFPNNPEAKLLEPPLEKRELTQFKEYLTDIFMNSQIASGKDLSKLGGFDDYNPDKFNVVKPYIEKDFDKLNMKELNDYWIELNNFPTELKARVKEYDYTEYDYDKCLYKEVDSNTKNELEDDIDSLKKSHMYTKIFKMIGETDKATIADILEKEFDQPESSKKLFAIFLKNKKQWMDGRKVAVAKYLQAKIAKAQWIPSAVNTKINTKTDCFSRLFEAEKIDFALLKPYNDVTIEVKKLEILNHNLEFGFPNDQFSADHFPTIVKFNLDLKKAFDPTNPNLDLTPKITNQII